MTTSFQLRPYQREAVTATVNYFRHSDDAAVIVLPTGAGKSLVIAELARIALTPDSRIGACERTGRTESQQI